MHITKPVDLPTRLQVFMMQPGFVSKGVCRVLGWLWGKLKGQGRYESQKAALQAGDARSRAALGGNAGTHPEILYFLARDAEEEVRRAVAGNPATPVQASALLAMDSSPDVRLALAARLAALLPGLSPEKHAQIYAYAVQALGALAQDEVLKIRRALSTALKDCAATPPRVAGTLARDVEREVSEPILRHCAALSDEDLLDILSQHPQSWVVSAIAGRRSVSAQVSGAVVGTGDTPGTGTLLKNAGAILTETLLAEIVARAPACAEWHAPLAGRRELSFDLAARLAGFVDAAVLSILEKRDDFTPEIKREVASMVRRRLDYARPGETAEARVARYQTTGSLNGDVIRDAVAWQDEGFVILALSTLARAHPTVVKKMLKAGAPRPVVALCWRAGLPMRLAVTLQQDMAKIPPAELIYARGGTDYPLSEADLKWQLEFYGLG